MTALAVTIGEQVRIVFTGWPEGHPRHGQPLELTWNSRTYRIPAGGSTHVPFELAKVYFGDPRSGENIARVRDEFGNDMIVPPRFTETKRLADLWLGSEFGTNAAKFREFIPGDRTHFQDGRITDTIPPVEVYSMDGQRIPMVTDDPYGDDRIAVQLSKAEADTQRQQLIDQSEMILHLKDQLAELKEKLGLGPATGRRSRAKAKTAPGSPEAPVDGAVEENPRMVFNPRTQRVQPTPGVPDADPTDILSLPQDQD